MDLTKNIITLHYRAGTGGTWTVFRECNGNGTECGTFPTFEQAAKKACEIRKATGYPIFRLTAAGWAELCIERATPLDEVLAR